MGIVVHCEYTKLNELYTLSEWIIWHLNDISIKLLKYSNGFREETLWSHKQRNEKLVVIMKNYTKASFEKWKTVDCQTKNITGVSNMYRNKRKNHIGPGQLM